MYIGIDRDKRQRQTSSDTGGSATQEWSGGIPSSKSNHELRVSSTAGAVSPACGGLPPEVPLRLALASVLRSFGTVRSLVVGAYAEASDDLHQLFDCVVESASKQHWRRIGARSAKEARSYFATTLRRAWGVHFAREFARHRIRRVVFVGAPRRQPGRPLATADGDWPALSAGEFAAHALRVAVRRRRVGGWPARPSVSTGREGRSVGS
ncbi:hypothetical protein EMIHUDRAFT_201747 [Emiliania huxleyi CCMP1516]|uniref:Uncharacterized protein n=2 Tax=Emiliania huxleyi TaxID=2903 RepID=A0A0D3KII9_EMIH1|nr:hypothetical protein EMIHUDRAFT_201747 [Emiliania huxleyi CCMP1516]EOD35574.1 hypothetical protein EMIHUDRAFT_201747 [Emiliania huxleyi CCMP1516]|eukprot:XP_005788003.1 hypothetical protein EMIHUDRAFT_201747 [Emiliania huxleyi CCMP1516]